MSGDRLVRFDKDGSAILPTPSRPIADLFEGLDGNVYVRDATALHRIENDQLNEVVRLPTDVGEVRHIALGRDGSMWIVADQGIGPRSGDHWQLTPLAELGLDGRTQLAFDSENTLWAVAPEQALYREGDRWVPAQLDLLAPGYELLHPMASPVGPVHVCNNYLMTRLGKEYFDSVVVDYKHRRPHDADLDIAPDGYACVATKACDVVCANAIPPTLIWNVFGGYACDSLSELAVEASHRVWVASPAGLSLLVEGQASQEFAVADYPLLAGPITDMVAVD